MNKAFLFDLNGTIIDDMAYHTKAWFHLLNEELGANLSWEQVKKEMYGKNAELLIRVFGKDHFSDQEINRLSVEKERRYQEEFRPFLQLIPGLQQFFEEAAQLQVPMAIGSAAIPFNIDFVLDNLHIRHFFKAIISADDVVISKPDPETFLKGAAQLGISPKNCIVFEDAPKGVEAALHANMRCVVITTVHEPHEFAQYANVIRFIKDYSEITAEELT